MVDQVSTPSATLITITDPKVNIRSPYSNHDRAELWKQAHKRLITWWTA